MTIVCTDGKELVSDSQVSMGDMAHPSAFKKIYTPEENEYWEVYGVKVIAFGLAGDAEAAIYIREKLSEGVTHRTRFEHDDLAFGCIVIDENGTCYEWFSVTNAKNGRNTNRLLPLLPPLAIGSGRDYAYAVLSIGKDAKTAVKAAIKLDNCSGGELQIFKIPPKPETPSVRPKALEVPVVEKPATEVVTETLKKDD